MTSQIAAILVSLLVASVVIITLLVVVIHLLCLLRRDQREERWILVSLLQGRSNLSKCTFGKTVLWIRKHFTAFILLFFCRWYGWASFASLVAVRKFQRHLKFLKYALHNHSHGLRVWWPSMHALHVTTGLHWTAWWRNPTGHAVKSQQKTYSMHAHTYIHVRIYMHIHVRIAEPRRKHPEVWTPCSWHTSILPIHTHVEECHHCTLVRHR